MFTYRVITKQLAHSLARSLPSTRKYSGVIYAAKYTKCLSHHVSRNSWVLGIYGACGMGVFATCLRSSIGQSLCFRVRPIRRLSTTMKPIRDALDKREEELRALIAKEKAAKIEAVSEDRCCTNGFQQQSSHTAFYDHYDHCSHKFYIAQKIMI